MQLPLMDEEADMRLINFSLGQDLSTYLSHVRKAAFPQSPNHKEVTLVLGNPSCDLDSFICAFVLSYFYNARPNASKFHKHPVYVPVLNLPFIENGDLWRLRPEFGVAIRGAFDGLRPQAEGEPSQELLEAQRQREKTLLDQIITVHELTTNPATLPSLRNAFMPSEHLDKSEATGKVDTILVDHNAPAVENINLDDLADRFNLVGCIDHHVEENIVPNTATPRIVRLGIGSCVSLVTEHLRALNLWTAHKQDERNPGFQQISRLALTPILVDTWNLKAPGDRVSDLDRRQAAFLDEETGPGFTGDDLYQQVSTAKEESANLLRMDEIFARDFKSYTEFIGNDQSLNIGLGSVVRGLDWMTQHAGGREQITKDIVNYSRHGKKLLEIFGLLTQAGDRKQVAMFGFGDSGRKAIEVFEKNAGELQLEQWTDDEHLISCFDERIGKSSWKVWWMNDTSKSRKQVAPLIRDALHEAHVV